MSEATTKRDEPEAGQALCLSGGGYRAMLFHVGVFWRFYELGKLRGLKRISSVSGGSITAATLALAWKHLSFDPAKLHQDFVPHFVAPIRTLAGETIDRDAILGGLLLPGTKAIWDWSAGRGGWARWRAEWCWPRAGCRCWRRRWAGACRS